MAEVVTFGEAMVRLSTQGPMRLEQASAVDVNTGGSEYNVAINVARLGFSSSWVSCLPRNPLGRMIRNKAREQGVDTSNIVWTDDGRAGLYFLEFGASPRASSVVYDRAGSAISMMEGNEIDWATRSATQASFGMAASSRIVTGVYTTTSCTRVVSPGLSRTDRGRGNAR